MTAETQSQNPREKLGEFAVSQALSLGVELELQLLSTHHYDMAPYAPDMLALLKNAKVPGSIVPEVTASMIEISTGICQDAQDAYEQLSVTRDACRSPTRPMTGTPISSASQVVVVPLYGKVSSAMSTVARLAR